MEDMGKTEEASSTNQTDTSSTPDMSSSNKKMMMVVGGGVVALVLVIVFAAAAYFGLKALKDDDSADTTTSSTRGDDARSNPGERDGNTASDHACSTDPQGDECGDEIREANVGAWANIISTYMSEFDADLPEDLDIPLCTAGTLEIGNAEGNADLAQRFFDAGMKTVKSADSLPYDARAGGSTDATMYYICDTGDEKIYTVSGTLSDGEKVEANTKVLPKSQVLR